MTAKGRLASLASGLTPLERAILVMHPWAAGGNREEIFLRLLPPAHAAACYRAIEAIESANEELNWSNAAVVEGLYQDELQLGWLECLDTLLRRMDELEAGLKALGWEVTEGAAPAVQRRRKRIVVSALRQPRYGLARDLPAMSRSPALPADDATPPADWSEAREWLTASLRRAVELRFREYQAMRLVLQEMAQLLGEDLSHVEVRRPLDAIGAKIFDMYAGLQELTGRWELPDVDSATLAAFREYVDWEALREPPLPGVPGVQSDRERLSEKQEEQADALERGLAEGLRSRESPTVVDYSGAGLLRAAIVGRDGD